MATDCMPTAPAAPDLLVITTGCLMTFSIDAASGRPVRSAWPPGGNGLTIVIGRLGNISSAPAGPASNTGRSARTVTSDRSICPSGSDAAREGDARSVWYSGPTRYREGQSSSSANFAPAGPLGERQVPHADGETEDDHRG